MEKKWHAIISYITIIGWIIAYVLYNNEPIKSPLVRFHLKQGLGMAILGLLLGVAAQIVIPIVPILAVAYIFYILNLVIIILWIIGIINAANEQEKPVPLVDHLFVDKFDFIK